jgi:hypothetical protein
MATLPLWLTGTGSGPVVITPQSVNAGTGVMTDTTPVATMTGMIDNISVRSRKTTEEISPMDSLPENLVPIKTGTTVEVTEILKKAGTNLLAQAYYGSNDYFKVAVPRGAQSFLFYGLLSDYTETLVRGKNVGVATFSNASIGSANPTYT